MAKIKEVEGDEATECVDLVKQIEEAEGRLRDAKGDTIRTECRACKAFVGYRPVQGKRP